MPYSPTSPTLPFAADSDTSYSGAVAAAPHYGRKLWAYLALLYDHGPKTDQEAAALLHLPVSSVNSLRNGCMPKALRDVPSTQLVTKGGVVDGVQKAHATTKRRRWMLTECWRQAVAQRRKGAR